MEKNLEALKNRNPASLVDERDLYSAMTMGIIVAGRQIDLLRLKTLIDEAEEFNKVHHNLSFEHLAIVKKKEWEEFKRWKKDR